MGNKVCIMGLGYIGLPTAAFLSNSNFEVLGIDVKQEIVDKINDGQIHIVEPGLEEVVKQGVKSGNLRASLEVSPSDIFIIAVPTPFDEKKRANLRFVDEAVLSITKVLKPSDLVIIESTIPVGTTERVRDMIHSVRPDLFSVENEQIYLAHCPERVLPGNIIQELINNDRIVGGIDAESTEKAVNFYSSVIQGQVIKTNSKTAELTKLIENSFRDTNIAFANEVSMICESLGIDTWELIGLANRHPRVDILNPGPGVGGHCLAVDPWFVVESCPDSSVLIKTAREVNEEKTNWVYQRVLEKIQSLDNQEVTVGCFGLSYKQNSDDLRESPAMKIYNLLNDAGINTIACEPNLDSLEGDTLLDTNEAIKQSTIILFLVGHDEFRDISEESLRDKIVIDVCGVMRR